MLKARMAFASSRREGMMISLKIEEKLLMNTEL